MLIDAHVHTSGISRCSKRRPAQMIAQFLADETEGFVLANHCDPSYTAELGYKEWCKRYNDEYYLTKQLGDKYGIKVFYGIEVETTEVKKVHYLIYGITPDDLLHSPELYYLNQKELFEYCEANNFALVQAHPFRSGTTPQNPAYLHGVEISCHPVHKYTMSDEVWKFAKEHNLFVTCGSDFHGDSYKSKCGLILPDHIQNEHELKACICKEQVPLEVVEIINVEL